MVKQKARIRMGKLRRRKRRKPKSKSLLKRQKSRLSLRRFRKKVHRTSKLTGT